MWSAQPSFLPFIFCCSLWGRRLSKLNHAFVHKPIQIRVETIALSQNDPLKWSCADAPKSFQMFYQENENKFMSNEITTHKYLLHICQGENFTVCLERQRLGLRGAWSILCFIFLLCRDEPEAEYLIWKGTDNSFKADNEFCRIIETLLSRHSSHSSFLLDNR